MAKFQRKGPVEIDAIRWDGNAEEVEKFCGAANSYFDNGEFVVECDNGTVLRLLRGRWVVKTPSGVYAVYDDYNFKEQYAPIDEQ